MIDGYDADPATYTEMLAWSESSTGTESDASAPPHPVEANPKSLNIALVNFYRFAQECLTKAFDGLDLQTTISSFMTVADCSTKARSDLDLIIYYLHGSEVSDAVITQILAPLCAAFPTVPLIVFSDADSARQSKIMRAIMKSGAQGFVPMQSADLSTTLAALRFVSAGGTFVPIDLLLTARPERALTGKKHLTSRQADVLSHLKQGKANKIIAYDLGMSESTVKVHVRNIMSKMGATNRTEAVYKASTHDFS